jgi:hypothetical protein
MYHVYIFVTSSHSLFPSHRKKGRWIIQLNPIGGLNSILYSSLLQQYGYIVSLFREKWKRKSEGKRTPIANLHIATSELPGAKL